MKKLFLLIFLMVALGLSAVTWKCEISIAGNSAIDMNINTFKNALINGADNIFINANTQIDIHVDGSLQISVRIRGELEPDADLEAIAITIYEYFNTLLTDIKINIKYEISI